MGADGVLLKLGNGVFAVGRLCLHYGNVLFFPADGASGVSAARLQAGAAVKDDHDVFPQIARLFCLAFAQSFAGRDHQNDGDDAPGDAEHRQERAQFMGPQRSYHVEKEVAQRHSGVWTGLWGESHLPGRL